MTISFDPFISLINTPKTEFKILESDLDKQISQLANVIEKRQPLYHPIFGCHALQEESLRKGFLDRNCDLVTNSLSYVSNKNKVRIVDVGSNNGYVSHSLAQKGFHVIGLEINPDNLLLSQLIAAREGLNASFSNIDIFELVRAGLGFAGEVDVVLLFNVLHQLIFSVGLDEVKALLGWLSHRVDWMFIELARREDYGPRGLDKYLPWSPESVFEQCIDSEIIQVVATPRPVFILKRSTANFDSLSINPQRILYSVNTNSSINRKYYFGKNNFIKLYRSCDDNNKKHADTEIRSLLKLKGFDIAPQIINWHKSNEYVAIEMELLRGMTLREVIDKTPSRINLMRELRSLLKIHFFCNKKIGFHNDINPHNILMLNNDNLAVIDFELCREYVLVDPFATLLWVINDLIDLQSNSYKNKIHKSLFVTSKSVKRVDLSYYPDIDSSKLPEVLQGLVFDLFNNEDWVSTIERWYETSQSWSLV